jgi:hypothetical protein
VIRFSGDLIPNSAGFPLQRIIGIRIRRESLSETVSELANGVEVKLIGGGLGDRVGQRLELSVFKELQTGVGRGEALQRECPCSASWR